MSLIISLTLLAGLFAPIGPAVARAAVADPTSTADLTANSALTDNPALTADSRVDRLIKKGLVVGSPTAGYQLDKTITRAEMTKLLIGLIGQGALAERYKESASAYQDVAPGSWYTGYINLATEKGIINGYPDGSFQPDRSLTYAETVAMLINLIDPLTEDEKAGRIWPLTYFLKARASDLFAGLQGGIYPDGAALRHPAFYMVYNAWRAFDPDDQTSPANGTYQMDSPALISRAAARLPSVAAVISDAIFRTEQGWFLLPAGKYVGVLARNGEQLQVRYEGMTGYVAAACLSVEPVAQLGRKDLAVPYVSQISPVYAPVGCEGAALLMALKAQAYASSVGLKIFLDEMPKHDSNPAKGFVGSPYVPNESLRTTIYPPVLAQYASKYGWVADASGAAPNDLQREICNGNPVVVYATLYWYSPYYRKYIVEGETKSLLRNNHAVTVAGFDAVKRQYYIADPYNKANKTKPWYYWISAEKFDRIYNERRWALVVRKAPERLALTPVTVNLQRKGSLFETTGLTDGSDILVPATVLFAKAGVKAEWIGRDSCRIDQGQILPILCQLDSEAYVSLEALTEAQSWAILP